MLLFYSVIQPALLSIEAILAFSSLYSSISVSTEDGDLLFDEAIEVLSDFFSTLAVFLMM